MTANSIAAANDPYNEPHRITFYDANKDKNVLVVTGYCIADSKSDTLVEVSCKVDDGNKIWRQQVRVNDDITYFDDPVKKFTKYKVRVQQSKSITPP